MRRMPVPYSSRTTSPAEDELWAPPETPFDADPDVDPAFEEDVAREVAEIGKIADLDHLLSAWKTLNKAAKHLAADPRIVAAKDAKKAELLQKEAPA